MTKEFLQEILKTHKWDIIDKLIAENKEYFLGVSNIYASCIAESNIEKVNIYSLVINLSIFSFFLIGKYQFKLLFTDPAYAEDEFQKRFRYNKALTFQEFLKSSKKILSFYKVHVPLLNLTQILLVFKNTLYKGQIFEDLFISKISEYILKEYLQGNLSLEFIEYIINLTS